MPADPISKLSLPLRTMPFVYPCGVCLCVSVRVSRVHVSMCSSEEGSEGSSENAGGKLVITNFSYNDRQACMEDSLHCSPD